MTRRVAIRGLVIRDETILCVRLKNYKPVATLASNEWCTPGGGLDEGESIVLALEREMIEETGIKPVVGSLLYVQQFMHNGREHMEMFFHITNSDDYLNVDLSKTTHGLEEIEEIGFVDPKLVTVLPTFLATENLRNLSECPRFFSYLD